MGWYAGAAGLAFGVWCLLRMAGLRADLRAERARRERAEWHLRAAWSEVRRWSVYAGEWDGDELEGGRD